MTEKQELVLAFLRARGSAGASGLEIERECWPIVGVRDYVRRLRDKGYSIETLEMPRTEKGCRVVKYRLLATPSYAAAVGQTSASTDVRGLSPLPAAAQGDLFRQ